MSFTFQGWFMKQLPVYYTQTDTIKKGGKGMLARYLSLYEDELDDNIVSFITNFLDILDIDTLTTDSPVGSTDPYLPLLGGNNGEPPDITSLPIDYRRVIKYAIRIYKLKGTIPGYQLLFRLFGLGCSISEDNSEVTTKYDASYYDETFHYDDSCGKCSTYSIACWNLSGSSTTPFTNLQLDPKIIPQMMRFLGWIQPIDVDLAYFAWCTKFVDSFTTNPTNANHANVIIQDVVVYDNYYIYDNTYYDSALTNYTVTTTF